MQTLESIFKRKSTRNYKPEQLPEDVLQTILEAGFASPVAMANYKSLHITVVQSQEYLDKINRITEDALFKITGEREDQRLASKRPCPYFSVYRYFSGGLCTHLAYYLLCRKSESRKNQCNDKKPISKCALQKTATHLFYIRLTLIVCFVTGVSSAP